MSAFINQFIVKVEKRIKPREVAKMARSSEFMTRVPLTLQKKIVAANSKKSSLMGFVVEPYSFFLAYEIDENLISEYLPEDYELIPTSLFEETKPRVCSILGCFNVHTTVFWGTRMELYIIAKNKRTNLISWLICDYESNTYNYDPGNGFIGPTTDNCVFTTSYNGDLICSIKSDRTDISFVADLKESCSMKLNQRLWVEGNLSIDYSGTLCNDGNVPFGLIFDPLEMTTAQNVILSKVNFERLSMGFITPDMKPFECCYFPYAQHYVTTVFPEGHQMKSEKDLERKIEEFVNKQ